MEDNKILENTENNENIGNTENSEELNAELEALAKLFQKELDKTTAEYEEGSTETEAVSESDDVSDNIDENPDDDTEAFVCVICGETVTAVKDGICENCLAELRKRPFRFSKVLAILAVGIVALIAMRGFWQNLDGYSKAFEAKTWFSMGDMTSAKTAYDEAISFFEQKDVNPRNLYFESAEIIFIQMSEGSVSMTEVGDRVSKGLEDSFFTRPLYTRYKNMGNESLQLYATMQSFYAIVNKPEYAGYTIDNEQMYSDIMAEIEALVDSEVEFRAVDGKTEKTEASEAMVRFCQYMFAYTAGKSDEAQGYLQMVYESGPEYLWLYAYEYGLSAISSGDMDTAEKMAGALVEADRQDPDGYSLYSTIARLSGDYDKAIEWADKALDNKNESAELLRLKAMALAAKGDYIQAKAVIDEAMLYESYGLLYYTSIVIENELGNTEAVNETIDMLQMYGLSVSDRVNSYLSGEITAEQMFTEGSGDVE